jgi:Zn-dependent protease with chaperone function
MHSIVKQFTVFFIIAALVFIPFATAVAAGKEPASDDISAGAMAADLFFLRPVGLVAMVFGTAVYVVSLPFSLLGGNAGEAGQKLVVEPTKYTFKRQLGDF